MKSQQKQELDGIIDKIIGYFRFHDRKERDDGYVGTNQP